MDLRYPSFVTPRYCSWQMTLFQRRNPHKEHFTFYSGRAFGRHSAGFARYNEQSVKVHGYVAGHDGYGEPPEQWMIVKLEMYEESRDQLGRKLPIRMKISTRQI